ncbi:tRNA (adenosine(37)-N6)-threonylcarbamoyltransferase complex ATPase subunit type 1 TsaE [Facklamia sp. 7083-14-GEN3]|uniref:tRNA (adenosine(37)-N6)-threonylcarbamoyltransferase complex ATPase subunit type 1 TsaE n=1 Tax=Facklamia sp. 7083-14-GEN3 TaxID=2973478 RepID=UPI00215CB7A2|nr:tRNA (adenosine(37)-N6)-threonylcarbamoyltransferase complex ATPase subunit type 1 TsaE [Facklamia sp. 7083-14-GEN3]MCR8969755.1 tRNA (adenosine(37)-N6)-threonylcarbamoyltransferase complex ATPase subunit type 1 TsaE [Facklamia sp. 7083-14-GEN3]
MINFTSHNLVDTQNLAKILARVIQPGSLILLSGPLGSGKTAFTQAFGRQLGIDRAIKSPTYTIAKEYELNQLADRMVHIDAYRLEEGGADTVDFDLFFDQQTISLVEWPQYIMDYLPKNYIKIAFELVEQNQRQIEITLSPKADNNHQIIFQKFEDHIERID